ncbi:MAG: ABC transporter permease [Solirubrobacteraceae bacterium]
MSTTVAFLGEFGDAIEYIFQSRESQAGGAQVGGGENWRLIGEHLKVTGAAMGLAIAVALPLGLWLGHTGRGAFLTISVSNVGRAVPSVALIALFVAFFPRTSAFVNVTLALALLAIPPILTNAYVGVRQVSRDAVDAARGMGMSGAQVVRSVELPLALPLVFGGIKTSTVNVIATATIAPLVGVLTLGDPIISGTVHGRAGQIGASIMVAGLAVAAELGLSAVQRAVTPTGVKLERGALAPRTGPLKRRIQTVP